MPSTRFADGRPMSVVTVRPAVPADQPALGAMLREIYAYFGSLEDDALPEPALIAASALEHSPIKLRDLID